MTVLTRSQYIWESTLIFLYLYLLHLLLLSSLSVVSDSLWPHGLQHDRLPCFLPSPGACSNSCPLSWWCHPIISSSVIPFLLPSIFPRVKVFSNALHIRWPKYWSFSFSISPSNECSEFISFRIDWFDLLAVQGTLKNLKHQFFGAQPFYGPTITSIHDYWKNHSFD